MISLLGGAQLALAQAPSAEPRPALNLALDAELSRLLRIGFDKPEKAMQGLQELRRAAITARQEGQLRLAEARLQVLAGDLDGAKATAALLERDAAVPIEAVKLLHAEIMERAGQTGDAAELAHQALQGLESTCPTPASSGSSGSPPPRSIEGCDFRLAWSALRVLGRSQLKEGRLPVALATAQRGLELAEAGGDSLLSALSLGQMALLEMRQQQAERATANLALAVKKAQGDSLTLAQLKNFEANLAASRGDSRGQLKALEDGLRLAMDLGAGRLSAQLLSNTADAYLQLQQPAKALALGRQALAELLRFKDVRVERSTRLNIALALIQLGQFDEARRELARGSVLRGEQPDQGLRAQELQELGEAWAKAGQAKEAIALYHEERKLSADLTARNREAALQLLKIKYDSDRKQRDLELLQRERSLVDSQLLNRKLAQQVGIALALLLGLSLVLVAVMVKRVRAAQKRLKANELLLRAQSERDPLTDLANRRHLLAVMAMQPKAQFSGALLMVDIDHFKHVNDEYGHGVGDLVICEVARRISHAVRSVDLVVRWGGEEFLVFAPDVSQEQLMQLAQRILDEVAYLPVQTETGPLRVTVSIGFAHFPLPPAMLDLHWEQAVNWADMALYTAKSRGRNRAMGIATVAAGDADALMQIEADFDAACSSERVSLVEVMGPSAL
ncbi:sensor domain-containing diguanylate cyclase [Paucibacter sp. Y2R2-4]|uniref:GGDEF domain-containing protein n=1 Tax=Paucibacter sp. Y2R2-4 TaxID=2893553 RepID=UPI0021E468C2|nr:diguanylate cyclase [Paucibacter sp. Y2R2-4]MCV2352020.1 diguanylate cyclase [Paucibacter sp. Y2R2-4]